ncbi:MULTISPECIES: hypothetical protein [unclassified Streptomyces]|uniref:hypothetical protein n=1 Tax=unclassified Streptomyces TaxID=2593676 RepID=UPI003391D918
MTRRPTITVLTTAFYAFYDLHRPAYHAYAAARLPLEEAQIAVSHLFDLVAGNWTTVVSQRFPSAWAWERHTRAVARRNGRIYTATEDISLLHDQLLLSIDQIATVTGTEPATVTALLAAAHRSARAGTTRPRPWTTTRPTTWTEARRRNRQRAMSGLCLADGTATAMDDARVR